MILIIYGLLVFVPCVFMSRKAKLLSAKKEVSLLRVAFVCFYSSLYMCWTIVAGGGHGVGISPIPSWLVLGVVAFGFDKGIANYLPHLFISPLVPMLVFLFTYYRARKLKPSEMNEGSLE